MDYPFLSREEFDEFERDYLLDKLTNFDIRYGRRFIWWFPEVADALRENSNLGTPPGVYNPSNDDIIEYETCDKRARALILDLVEIQDSDTISE